MWLIRARERERERERERVCVCLSVIVTPVQWPGRLQVHSFSSTDLVLVLMDPFLG
jgi:hypothetical protein